MIRVGLSGCRFSGKNKIASLFEDIQIPVFDADLVIKFILTHEYKILAEIRDKVGHQYFNDGILNPKEIELDGVFSKIIDIIEPKVFDSYKKFEQKNLGAVYTVFNCSILFERKWHKKMDHNISVYAPFLHRVERSKELKEKGLRDVTSRTIILNKETDELTKNSMADHVIHNYNEFNVKNQVDKIDQKIIDEYIRTEYKKEL